MAVFLDQLIPRFLPELNFQCIEHEGKSDLLKSIPRKLQVYSATNVRFLIIRDNDGGDCLKIKEQIQRRCQESGAAGALIRIAIQELEAWYLGDIQALEAASPEQKKQIMKCRNKAKFRDPDHLGSPSQEIKKIIQTFQKVEGARRIGKHISFEKSSSKSFLALLDGIQKLQSSF